jgi:hypothetical protein
MRADAWSSMIAVFWRDSDLASELIERWRIIDSKVFRGLLELKYVRTDDLWKFVDET